MFNKSDNKYTIAQFYNQKTGKNISKFQPINQKRLSTKCYILTTKDLNNRLQLKQ